VAGAIRRLLGRSGLQTPAGTGPGDPGAPHGAHSATRLTGPAPVWRGPGPQDGDDHWRALPVMPRALVPITPTVQTDRFESGLATRSQPRFLALLVHDRSALHPSGVAEGIAVLAPAPMERPPGPAGPLGERAPVPGGGLAGMVQRLMHNRPGSGAPKGPGSAAGQKRPTGTPADTRAIGTVEGDQGPGGLLAGREPIVLPPPGDRSATASPVSAAAGDMPASGPSAPTEPAAAQREAVFPPQAAKAPAGPLVGDSEPLAAQRELNTAPGPGEPPVSAGAAGPALSALPGGRRGIAQGMAPTTVPAPKATPAEASVPVAEGVGGAPTEAAPPGALSDYIAAARSRPGRGAAARGRPEMGATGGGAADPGVVGSGAGAGSGADVGSGAGAGSGSAATRSVPVGTPPPSPGSSTTAPLWTAQRVASTASESLASSATTPPSAGGGGPAIPAGAFPGPRTSRFRLGPPLSRPTGGPEGQVSGSTSPFAAPPAAPSERATPDSLSGPGRPGAHDGSSAPLAAPGFFDGTVPGDRTGPYLQAPTAQRSSAPRQPEDLVADRLTGFGEAAPADEAAPPEVGTEVAPTLGAGLKRPATGDGTSQDGAWAAASGEALPPAVPSQPPSPTAQLLSRGQNRGPEVPPRAGNPGAPRPSVAAPGPAAAPGPGAERGIEPLARLRAAGAAATTPPISPAAFRTAPLDLVLRRSTSQPPVTVSPGPERLVDSHQGQGQPGESGASGGHLASEAVVRAEPIGSPAAFSDSQPVTLLGQRLPELVVARQPWPPGWPGQRVVELAQPASSRTGTGHGQPGSTRLPVDRAAGQWTGIPGVRAQRSSGDGLTPAPRYLQSAPRYLQSMAGAHDGAEDGAVRGPQRLVTPLRTAFSSPGPGPGPTEAPGRVGPPALPGLSRPGLQPVARSTQAQTHHFAASPLVAQRYAEAAPALVQPLQDPDVAAPRQDWSFGPLPGGSAAVQRGGEPAAAPAAAPASAGAPAPGGAPDASHQPGQGGGDDVDELSRKLYDRIRDRLKAELYLDRERAGQLSDLTV
jgi:hypothetical protein